MHNLWPNWRTFESWPAVAKHHVRSVEKLVHWSGPRGGSVLNGTKISDYQECYPPLPNPLRGGDRGTGEERQCGDAEKAGEKSVELCPGTFHCSQECMHWGTVGKDRDEDTA